MTRDRCRDETSNVESSTLNFQARLHHAAELTRQELLAARAPDGHWVGELSSSALSTATAVCALSVVERHNPSFRIQRSALRISKGLNWLARNVNADGGWGDTPLSLSNISTTTLCWAAFGGVLGVALHYLRYGPKEVDKQEELRK